MAINKALIDGVQPTLTTAVDSYTSPTNGAGTRIIAFTASIVTGTETYRVFVGSTATSATEIIPATSLTGPEKDSPSELMNHLIPAGQKLFVQVSTGSTISFRVTGIEF
jgi:hypothetical protein